MKRATKAELVKAKTPKAIWPGSQGVGRHEAADIADPEEADAKPEKGRKGKAAAVELPEEKVSVIDAGRGVSILTLPNERLQETLVLIVSDAVLVMGKFQKKMRDRMRDKQQGKATEPRTAKIPEEEARGACHMFEDGSGYGLPAAAFKAALVESSRFVAAGKDKVINMTYLKGAIRIMADGPEDTGMPLVRIMVQGDGYKIREDFVRNDSGVADIRYRPQFDSWSSLLRIAHPPNITRAQVLQLVRAAGRFNGIGEWRPMSKESKSGSWGTWRLATTEEILEFSRKAPPFMLPKAA